MNEQVNDKKKKKTKQEPMNKWLNIKKKHIHNYINKYHIKILLELAGGNKQKSILAVSLNQLVYNNTE